MDLANEIKQLTEQVERVKAAYGRAQGRWESESANLKKLGFADLNEAVSFVETDTKRLDEVEAELIKDVEEFKNVYGNFLAEASK
jgi:hypothetical protein